MIALLAGNFNEYLFCEPSSLRFIIKLFLSAYWDEMLYKIPCILWDLLNIKLLLKFANVKGERIDALLEIYRCSWVLWLYRSLLF